MAWFRRRSGQLIHAVGGLAHVALQRGWEPVPDDVAEAELRNDDTPAPAKARRKAAKKTTSRRPARSKTGGKSKPEEPIVEVTFTKGPRPASPEVKKMVDDAIRDEMPPIVPKKPR